MPDVGLAGCTFFPDCKFESFPLCGCEAEAICGVVVTLEARIDDGTPEWNVPALATCVVESMASSSAGAVTLRMHLNNGTGDDLGSYADYITLIGDGTAMVLRDYGPLEDNVGPNPPPPDGFSRVQVRPDAHFATCLETGEAADVANCLLDWYSGDLCEPPNCCPLESTGIDACVSADTG